MKKVLFSLFFICLFLFPCLADYTVDQATVNAEVAQNGKTKVTATYQLTFDSQQDQVQIPLPDGDISRVSAETYRYKVDKTDTGVDVVLSKGTFSGTQSFTISYTVNVSPDSSTDGDVFTLGLLSSRWATPVGACAFQVTLPQPSGTVPADYTITPQVLSGYYGPLSDTETGLTVNGTIVTGTAADRMAYDSLALAVTLPSGYFYVRSTAIPMIHVTYLLAAAAANAPAGGLPSAADTRRTAGLPALADAGRRHLRCGCAGAGMGQSGLYYHSVQQKGLCHSDPHDSHGQRAKQGRAAAVYTDFCHRQSSCHHTGTLFRRSSPFLCRLPQEPQPGDF